MSKIVSGYGEARITIPAGQKIAVFSLNDATVYTITEYANFPSSEVVDFTASGGVQTVSSEYVSETTVYLRAGAADAYYDVGVTPNIAGVSGSDITSAESTLAIQGLNGESGTNGDGGNIDIIAGTADGTGRNGAVRLRGRITQSQAAPSALTTTATLTAGQITNGILTGEHTAGATQTYTLPSGAVLGAGLQMEVNDSFDWSLMNLSTAAADTLTVAASSGHTLVGLAVVQSLHSTTGAVAGAAGLFRTRKTAVNTFVTHRIL